jgi:hypothetical protein
VCCRQLYGNDRLLVAWPAADHAVVLLVGPHDTKAGDVYDQLLEAVGIDTLDDERAKPPCCDEVGVPPVDEEVALEVADAVNRTARRRRRRS